MIGTIGQNRDDSRQRDTRDRPAPGIAASGFHGVVALGLVVALFLASPTASAADPVSAPASANTQLAAVGGDDPHYDLFSAESYPSASQCAVCHKQIYSEWASSNHAYAAISPMFHKFEQRINELASGTVGHFCVRCHVQVGTQMGETREMPLWERARVSREGVTCITCHRVAGEFGRVNGERVINPGNIHEPVLGMAENSALPNVLADKNYWKVATGPEDRGAKIHAGVIKFEQINQSQFCVSCHQVAVNPGIKLEVVWEQYRDSPAHKHGITCQDCHMGQVPGRPDGYAMAPAAVVNGKPTPERRHYNHAFYGPGYPVAHPGIFPHNPDAEQWTMEEWLQFDYRAGWGVPEWEDKVEAGDIEVDFPAPWSDRFTRQDARDIVNANLERLEEKRDLRRQVMENSIRIDGPFFDDAPEVGSSFRFSYKVTNTDEGHNLPSGSLGAQPELWLNVALVDPDGKTVWESGYVDSHGDMADLHSLDVASGAIEHDDQLFNLQTKFLTTGVKGTDREMYLPVNLDIDQLPHIRPAAVPTTVLNHPPFIRMEGRSLPPLSSRTAKYKVPADRMTKPGTYKLAVRMRSRAEPIYFMKFVRSTVEMEEAMNQWMLDIHPYTVEIDVNG